MRLKSQEKENYNGTILSNLVDISGTKSNFSFSMGSEAQNVQKPLNSGK